MSPAGPRAVEVGAFADCLAFVLAVAPGEVPRPHAGDAVAAWRRWLAGRNLGLVGVADPQDFSWPGHWIARLEPAAGEDRPAVVMFGVPSGVVWDPRERPPAAAEPIAEGFVVAPLDLHLPGRTEPYRTDGEERTDGRVEAIFVAPRAEARTREVDRARAVPGRGLEGDRYVTGSGTFSGGAGDGLDLTLIEAEALDALVLADGTPLGAAEARRNVVTRGVDLNALVGRRFTVGAVECAGRRLCEPCAHLQRLTRPGVLRGLVHRGGLRADIISDGEIVLGDPVRPLA